MALPKVNVTIHEKYLVGIGKTVKFRSYKIKEQKILLEAKEQTGDDAEAIQRRAMMQVMQLCIVDDTLVDDLPLFDFIALFIAMRSKSVDNIATVKYTYGWNDEEGKAKESDLVIHIDLDKIETVIDESISDTIMIDDNVGIKLKYPSIGFIVEGPTDEELILNSIECVFDAETVHYDYEPDELREFIEGLEIKHILQIEQFLANPPHVEHIEHVTLDDGEEMDLVFKTLPDFFL